MTTRQKLLLAHSIVEYQQVIDHMTALIKVGGHVSATLLGRCRREQRRLLLRWRWESGEAIEDTSAVLAEVREWITAHITELDDLLAESKEDA